MKTIVITGDLLWDYNLLQYPDAPGAYHQPFAETVLHEEPGGAWFLSRIVKVALRDSPQLGDIDIRAPKQEPPSNNVPVGKAYSVWSLSDGFADKKNRVWRIQRFLGCQRPADIAKLSRVEIASGEDIADPDILVIDDLSLGFRGHKHLWPDSLNVEHDGPKKIILKACSAPDQSALFRRLLDGFAERLTIVISADALRLRGAKLTTGLSWDQTIEEIVKEFESGASAYDLARCRHVIVHFNGAAAAAFARCRLKIGPPPTPQEDPDAIVAPKAQFERFVYHPKEVEGRWKARLDGKMFGAGTILTAAVVRHEADPESFPLFLCLSRGLAATRDFQEQGAGARGGFLSCPDETRLHDTLDPPKDPLHPKDPPRHDPADMFRSAFPHAVLNHSERRNQPASVSNLLLDETGYDLPYVFAKAVEVVQRGPVKALDHAPRASYGEYVTFDRKEIERINMVRGLIIAYRDNLKDTRPLSIAVFGPPGSGKSFDSAEKPL